MKILESKYPMGSIKGQRSAGRYIDQTLHENIDILAKNIVKDMTFMGVASSSTLEVRTGKSTLMQQIAEDYTDLVNQHHGLNLKFTIDNICWRPKELIEKAFKLPKYSCIVLDEWEDSSYFSELSSALRKFFRKCGQLNLFIIVIIPNFFQLPLGYAVSRSVFFIDVKFQGEFERGYFSFYNFQRKKELYIKGKKFHDYHVVQANFIGRFVNGYSIDEEIYRAAKLKDMLESEKEEEKPKVNEKEIKSKLFKQVYDNLDKVSQEKLSKAFGISRRTALRWMKGLREENETLISGDSDTTTTYSNNLIDRDDVNEPKEEQSEGDE